MKKSNKRIEIVSSPSISLSSMSQESRNAILGVLKRHYADVAVTLINDLSDLEALAARRPDLVFLGMDFLPLDTKLHLNDPNKVWLAEFLDDRDIAYTGSRRSAHELEHNKHRAKQAVHDAGLMTSPFIVTNHHESQSLHHNITYPVFVKPTNRGGGSGIDGDSYATTLSQLNNKVASISRIFQSDSLVEEYLSGREFSVAILKNDQTGKFAVMPIELVAVSDRNGVKMLSKHVKNSNTEVVLEVIDPILKNAVNKLAISAFKALGARDYGRIDIRLDVSGTPHFLEANLIPSLISGYGSFPKACLLNIGLSYEDMILQITRLGLRRSRGDASQIVPVVTRQA